MLNLGLSVPEQQVELVDVLSSELAFKEAYQEFVNYANVCEIVAKARASEECMGFACELLGTSIENVRVSFESFSESIGKAWKAFLNFWTNIYKWIMDHIAIIYKKIHRFATGYEFKKPYLVHISQTMLDHIRDRAVDCIKESLLDKKKVNVREFAAQDIVRSAKDEPTQLKYASDVDQWVDSAKKTVMELDKVIKKATDLKVEDMDHIYSDARRGGAVKRYIMRYFPQVVKKITKDIESLKFA